MDEILLKTTKFNVELRHYHIPGRGPATRELVVHPGAVTILPLLDPSTVVMIRNYRFSAGKELLELPAGTLEPAEQPIDCARRELEEETGYCPGNIEPLCEFYTSPGFTNEWMQVFVASELTPTKQDLDATEQIRVETLSLADALDAAVDGRIIDAKSIAALQVYYYRMTRKT